MSRKNNEAGINFVRDNAVDEGFLSDWYQHSVTDDPPVWTDEHIAEVCGDFYLIPREVIDGKINREEKMGDG